MIFERKNNRAERHNLKEKSNYQIEYYPYSSQKKTGSIQVHLDPCRSKKLW